MAAPSVFSAAWFKDNLPKYRDAAWNNPTIENVRAFLYLQRFAIDRSEQVADATELAVVGDPFLDEISRRPGSTFAAQNIDRQAGAAKSQLIAEVAERAGVFFFFKSDCPQCELQAPLLKALEGEGFTIVPISVDGKALPNSPFPDFKVDAGHAQRLGVQTYPALFLASASGEFAALGQSTMSLPELEHRILVSARRANWITDEAFNRTRPVLNYDNNLAERLSDSGSREELSLDPATGFIEPGVLMDYMRRSLGGQ